jgi:hypothetical protein
MRTSTGTTLRPQLRTLIALALSSALLMACGGGDSSNAGGNNNPTSSETAQSVSANGLMLGEETAIAHGLILTLAQAVVGGGQATQTIACAGGGNASFIVSGGTFAEMTNGQLDAGESYTIDFDQCRDGAGSGIDGVLSLNVVAVSGNSITVGTATQAVTISEPGRTLTLNGSSTFTRSSVTTGSTVVTTERWVSPQISFVSVHNGRTSSLTLRDVDLTRTVTSVNGVQTSVTSDSDFSLTLLGVGGWSATISTDGQVSYSPGGVPASGSWLITLPHDRIGVVLAANTATVTVDHGPDGSIDRTYVFSLATLTASGL